MKIMKQPQQAENWTEEIQKKFKEGKLCIEIPFNDFEDVMKMVATEDLTPNLRVVLSVRSDQPNKALKRSTRMFNQTTFEVNHAQFYTGDYVQRVLEEEVDVDMPLTVADHVVAYTIEIAKYSSYGEPEASILPVDKQDVWDNIVDEAHHWERNSPTLSGVLNQEETRSRRLHAATLRFKEAAQQEMPKQLLEVFTAEWLKHELLIEARRQTPFPGQVYPVPYESTQQYKDDKIIINALKFENRSLNYPLDSVHAARYEASRSVEHAMVARRKLDEFMGKIEPTLRTKLEVFQKELPAWIKHARKSSILRNWDCTLRRGRPPLAYWFPNKHTENALVRCTYIKGDEQGCAPGEFALFKGGMVNYNMTFTSLLDMLERADDYKSLCFADKARTRENPDYWEYPHIRDALTALDAEDQDIWVNLKFVGSSKRAILRRTLRKFKPQCLIFDEFSSWTEEMVQQLLEEEITLDLPLRLIMEVTERVEEYMAMIGSSGGEKAWPGVLDEREQEVWNEQDRLSKQAHEKDYLSGPHIPEYKQRELKLFHDVFKVEELLKRKSTTKIWKSDGVKGTKTFTEHDFAVAWKEDLDWDLEYARRFPTLYQRYPEPYADKEKSDEPMTPFPNAVAKLKFGEDWVAARDDKELASTTSVVDQAIRAGNEDKRLPTRKEIEKISEQCSKIAVCGSLNIQRSSFFRELCRTFEPENVDVLALALNTNNITNYCDGHSDFVRVNTFVNEVEQIVMVDTGAAGSIVPLWAATKLHVERRNESSPLSIFGVTGGNKVTASREMITVAFCGREYTGQVWVIWSPEMDHMSMPIIGHDFLKGTDLKIDLETGEIVGKTTNIRTKFFEGCHNRKGCKLEAGNRTTQMNAIWKIQTELPKSAILRTALDNRRKMVRFEIPTDGATEAEEILGKPEEQEESIFEALQPYLNEDGVRVNPRFEEHEHSYMFLDKPCALRGLSHNHSNRYQVHVRVARERRVKDGVYILIPNEEICDFYRITIVSQLVNVENGTSYIHVMNRMTTRNVLPSGHPLFEIHFLTDLADQYDKADDWLAMNAKEKLRLNTLTVEDRKLIDENFEEVWNKIDKQETAMTDEQKQRLKQVLKNNPIFPVPGKEFATTGKYSHRIELLPEAKPQKCYRNMRRSERERLAIESQVNEWLKTGVIKPSTSPWAAPLVLVPKKGTDKLRLCVNYRKLNNLTKKDSFPLPIIDDIMHSLKKAKYFGTLDLANGFNQIPMAREDQEKTAFVCHMGLFEFTRMPFGLCNAPATFQRVMTDALQGLIWTRCFVYIDDIIVFGNTFEEYMENMKVVLERLSQQGLTINPRKCSFGQKEIKYLGHILSGDGHRIDPDQISALTKYPRPKTVADLWGFVGLAGFYRQFIPKFSTVTAPLQAKLHETADLSWTMVEENAFVKLKILLSTDPVIAHFDPSKPCEIRTDASLHGIGGILRQDGRIVGCKSRALNSVEKRYSVTEWEALAILYSIQKFRHFLDGTPFTVVTDHQPLVSMLRRGKESETENKRINKWLLDLVDFDFKVIYKKGKLHADADAVSRHPVDQAPNPDVDDRFGAFTTCIRIDDVEPEVSDAEVYYVLIGKTEDTPQGWTAYESQLNSVTVNTLKKPRKPRKKKPKKKSDQEDLDNEDSFIDLEQEVPTDPEQMRERQETDAYLQKVIEILEGRRQPENPKEQKLGEKFRLVRGVLCRMRTKGLEVMDLQCIPRLMRKAILATAHDVPEAGHMGENKTMQAIVDKFWWYKMVKDVRQWVATCRACQPFKTDTTGKKGFLGRTISKKRGEVGSIDFTGPYNESRKGNTYIVAYVDHFSKFLVAKAVPRATAKEAAEFLLHNVITKIPGPQSLVSDNGSHFTGELVNHLARISGMKRRLTTPYHPQANTAAERLMAVIKAGLGKLCPDPATKKWDDYLDSVVYSYNTSVNVKTGYSPWHVMFGEQPRIPVDSFLVNLKPEDHFSLPEYMREMSLKIAALEDKIWSAKEAEFRSSKDRYDRKVKPATYQLDDLVMVRNMNFKPGQGSNKFQPTYSGPFMIVKKGDSGKWFEVKPRDTDKATKRTSVDLIKPWFARKKTDFTENPTQELTFTEALELDPEYEEEGTKAKELPATKQDKIQKEEDQLLEEGDIPEIQPKEYVTARGRTTTIKHSYKE